MWTPDICIYHGNCYDGFAAAFAVTMRWPQVPLIATTYGKALPSDRWFSGKNVLFVDFSVPRDALVRMARYAKSIVIIDHHKTAHDDLTEFIWNPPPRRPMLVEQVDNLLGGLRQDKPPVLAWFDMEQSGATMTWAFAHGAVGAPMPAAFSFIEDRDLWRFRHADTKAFSAGLRTLPMDFKVWAASFDEVGVRSLIECGKVVLQAHEADIARFLADTYMVEIGGYRVPTVNVPYRYASDVAHALLKKDPETPFATAWFVRGDGMVQFSLRSSDDRVDVSQIAAMYGGGGHRNAAGFQYPSTMPLPAIQSGANKDQDVARAS